MCKTKDGRSEIRVQIAGQCRQMRFEMPSRLPAPGAISRNPTLPEKRQLVINSFEKIVGRNIILEELIGPPSDIRPWHLTDPGTKQPLSKTLVIIRMLC